MDVAYRSLDALHSPQILLRTDWERVWHPGGGGGHSHVQPVQVRAALKGMVFKQFGLGWGIEIRAFWSRKGFLITGKLKWF